MLYANRPSKSVTRLMLLETVRRLDRIAPMKEYQYIGFGALEFVDFDLFHRSLGIADMVSIESDPKGPERYLANRPFNGIEVFHGRASDVLPELDLKRLSIVWLDYTCQLNAEVLADVQLLARQLIPGSILAVTVNSYAKVMEGRRERLAENVGADRVPAGWTDAKLGGWGLADAQSVILSASISAEMASRPDAATWQQLLNIHYEDDAKLQLYAGIIGAPAMMRSIEGCHFEDLPFVREDLRSFVVSVPQLTKKERRALHEQLPPEAGLKPKLPGVKESDVEHYVGLYRWLAPAE